MCTPHATRGSSCWLVILPIQPPVLVPSSPRNLPLVGLCFVVLRGDRDKPALQLVTPVCLTDSFD